MTTESVAHFLSLYNRFFPERQIYHRCNGQVQFTTISSRAQMVAVLIGCMVLGWIAYASVNVIFLEPITARMEVNLRESKRRWEAELADVLGDYERLQAGVSVVKEQLNQSLLELEERQRQVDTVLDKKSSFLDLRTADLQQTAAAIFSPPEEAAHISISVLNQHDNDPTPRVSRVASASQVAALPVDGLSSLLRTVSSDTSPLAPRMLDQVAVVENLEARVARLQAQQHDDLVTLEERVTDDIARLEKALERTGISYRPMVTRFQTALDGSSENSGQGGPFISASAETLDTEDLERHTFARKTLRIENKLRRLAALHDTLNALPITRPVAAYRITSGFGTRPDPFTGRFAMHYGLDIAGRRGTPVVATAAGKVITSGLYGGYGRMVKIDHGNGLVTVYGHMDKNIAKQGQHVKRGDVIGTLGNTGRSTAPHLHYEIKYGKKAIDPRKLFEAGRYVFENQG